MAVPGSLAADILVVDIYFAAEHLDKFVGTCLAQWEELWDIFRCTMVDLLFSL